MAISNDMAMTLQEESSTDSELLAEQLNHLVIGDPPPSTTSTETVATEGTSHQPSLITKVLMLPELAVIILGFISPLPPPLGETSLLYNIEDPRSAAVQSRANALWTLLHAQRVNQPWRYMITNTQSLQQCLFLVPHTASPASWAASSPGSARPVLNPLIQTITHWRFSHLDPDQMGGKYSAHMIVERKDYAHLLSLPCNQKSMLLSQPPVTDVTAMVWERETEPESGQSRVRPPPSLYSVKRIRDDGGVVFGKVLEKVGRMFEEDVTLKAIKICTA